MNCWSLSFRLMTGSISLVAGSPLWAASVWALLGAVSESGKTRSVRRCRTAPVSWSQHEEDLRWCPGVSCAESDRLIHVLRWVSCWKAVTVTAVIPHDSTKNPHYRGNYRGYRKNTAVTITVSLSTGNSAIRSVVPENLTIEPNMKWIGLRVAEIWPFQIIPRWRRPPYWICSKRK